MQEAVRISWEVLRNAMQSWNITSREGLSEWIHKQGFPRHIFSGRVQERILNLAIARDIRGAVLESLCVHIALSWSQAAGSVARCDARQSSVSEWEVLDRIDLEEVFQTRFSVLQGCPVQLKGRFRQSVRSGWHWKHGKRQYTGEMQCKSVGHGSCSCCCRSCSCGELRDEDEVGKTELTNRFEKFAAGQWEALFQGGPSMQPDRTNPECR